jgi:hypothetical protein
MKHSIDTDVLAVAQARGAALIPGLAGLGAVSDARGMSLLVDAYVEEMESFGVPREFSYRLLVGSLAASLGHHVDREEIDIRLIETMGGQP